MTRILVAEFADSDALVAATRSAKEAGHSLIDAFTPFPVEGLSEIIGAGSNHVRVAMFIGGVAIATLAYATEYYSAVIDNPINSGGRPLHSWPAFMLFPFAVGILGAAVAGFATLLIQSGLPRLHHPVFDIEGFERASQDRFLLAIGVPDDGPVLEAAEVRLRAGGATAVREVGA